VGASEQSSRQPGELWRLLLRESQPDDCAPVGEGAPAALFAQEGDLLPGAVELDLEWLRCWSGSGRRSAARFAPVTPSRASVAVLDADRALYAAKAAGRNCTELTAAP
jgi:hypothetical protein